MTLTVSLLGPPRVARDGTPVSFDTRKATALLAYLALAERAHARDALAELLWPDHDTAHARGALRRTLSTLRHAIGDEHLETTRDLVALTGASTLDLDVRRFRALAGGDASRAELEAAVALCGGDLLEGFGLRDSPAFEDWQRLQADGLRRELAGALDRLAELDAAAGDHAAAIRHARRRVDLEPLHEPARVRLIRLLAGAGDRAGALAEYRTCVRVLSAELGVAPLPETTALYDAIGEGLADAPAGAAGAGTAEPAPRPGELPLVGRGAEWSALARALREAGPDGRVAVLEGEAGIGKTRLTGAVLAHARERGAATLTARCHEEEAGVAYAPVAQALRARLAERPDWPAAMAAHALGEAARLVPELAGPAPDVPGPPPGGPGAEGRFLDGVCEALFAAVVTTTADGDGHGQAGVLLVDDLQWADEATLRLLGYLLRRLDGRPLLVLLTWRLPRDARLRRALADAERTQDAQVHRLGRLSPVDVSELVRSVPAGAGAVTDGGSAPGDAPDLAEWLFAETEGVPFLLVEYLAALTTAPLRGADQGWPLPEGAQALIRARVDALGEVARQVLAAGAVLGRTFDVDTLRATAGRTDEETVVALEELVARGLVDEGPSGCAFGHEKVRALVYDDTGQARRRLLHRRAAAALAQPGPDREDRSALVARHLERAGRDGEAALAHARAAARARAVFAHADALAHLRAALALGHPERVALLTAAGDVQTLLGDYTGAVASYETAAAEARPQDVAVLERRLGAVHGRRGEWDLAEAHLRTALGATPAPDGEAVAGLHAELSLTLHERGDAAGAREHARRARELAEAGGDARAVAQALNILGVLARSDGDLDAARGHLERSADLAADVGDQATRVAALNNLALGAGGGRRTSTARSARRARRSGSASPRGIATARPPCAATSPTSSTTPATARTRWGSSSGRSRCSRRSPRTRSPSRRSGSSSRGEGTPCRRPRRLRSPPMSTARPRARPRRRAAPRPEAPVEPRQGEVLIWTDGACRGNPGPGGWAAILARSGRRRAGRALRRRGAHDEQPHGAHGRAGGAARAPGRRPRLRRHRLAADDRQHDPVARGLEAHGLAHRRRRSREEPGPRAGARRGARPPRRGALALGPRPRDGRGARAQGAQRPRRPPGRSRPPTPCSVRGMRLRDALRHRPGGPAFAGLEPDATPKAPGGKRRTLAKLEQRGVELAALQERLYAEATQPAATPRVLLVLQGMDTSGKGGTIEHVIGLVDPQGVRIASFKKPTAEELRAPLPLAGAPPVPGAGPIGIFDRSHYEDVLVARVHQPGRRRDDRSARYEEINRFEAKLAAGRRGDRQVLPAPLLRGAARAAAGPPGRPDQVLEVQPRRRRRASRAGPTTSAPTTRAGALQHRRRPRGTSSPPTASGTATGPWPAAAGDAARARPGVPRARPRRRGARPPAAPGRRGRRRAGARVALGPVTAGGGSSAAAGTVRRMHDDAVRQGDGWALATLDDLGEDPASARSARAGRDAPSA